MFRVALTYHPDIGTFRGARGAWKVFACWEPPVAERGVRVTDRAGEKVLVMDAPRKLHRHSFVNPTKLLREALAKATA